MSTEPVRETLGDERGHENVTLEECMLLRLLADDLHFEPEELADVTGRKTRTVARHISRQCQHGGRFW